MIKITKREIVTSIIIIAIMLMLGLGIGGKINNVMEDNNAKYYKAVHINTTELFKYGMDTSVGDAFVYGDLIAKDTVTYPEIGGQYLSIKKVKEEYTMHTRTVSDGKGKSHTEIYYTWDEVHTEVKDCEKVTFLNIEFKTSQFAIPSRSYITTKYESSDVRDKYYGYEVKSTGTIFTHLSSGNIEQSDISFFKDMTIDMAIESETSRVPIYIFWLFWIIFIGLSVYGFYSLDNRWLNKD